MTENINYFRGMDFDELAHYDSQKLIALIEGKQLPPSRLTYALEAVGHI